jgi:hypothetical protein
MTGTTTIQVVGNLFALRRLPELLAETNCTTGNSAGFLPKALTCTAAAPATRAHTRWL